MSGKEEERQATTSSDPQTPQKSRSSRPALPRKVAEWHHSVTSSSTSSPIAPSPRRTPQEIDRDHRKAERAKIESRQEFIVRKQQRETLAQQTRARGFATPPQRGLATPLVPKRGIVIEISDSEEEEENRLGATEMREEMQTESDIEVERNLRRTSRFRGSKKSTIVRGEPVLVERERYSSIEKGKGKMREAQDDVVMENRRKEVEDDIMWVDETDDDRIISPPPSRSVTLSLNQSSSTILNPNRHNSHQFSFEPYEFDITAHLPRRYPLASELGRMSGTAKKSARNAERDMEIKRRIQVQRTLTSSASDGTGAVDTKYRLEYFKEPSPDEHRVRFFLSH